MNLLAHALLGEQFGPKINAVNVLWDFIGRDLREDQRPFIRQGARLHQLIDRTTDTSEHTHHACSLIAYPHKKIAGVVVDLGYDYVLSNSWTDYADTDRLEFIAGIISSIGFWGQEINDRAVELYGSLRRWNWFADYHTIPGMGKVISRVGQRVGMSDLFDGAEKEIEKHASVLSGCFAEVYPVIRNKLESWDPRAV